MKITISCISFKAIWGLGRFMVNVIFVFQIKVEYIATIDVGKVGI